MLADTVAPQPGDAPAEFFAPGSQEVLGIRFNPDFSQYAQRKWSEVKILDVPEDGHVQVGMHEIVIESPGNFSVNLV